MVCWCATGKWGALPGLRGFDAILSHEIIVSHLIITLSIYAAKGWVEGFGDGLVAVVNVPAYGEGGLAIPVFAGLANFFAACGFAVGAGDEATVGVVFVADFVLAHDRELYPVDGL